MEQVKNYLLKTILIGLLSLLMGCMAIYLSSPANYTDNNVLLVIVFSFIGIAVLAILLLLKWEHLLFIFALSIGFQVYDPSPFELMFFILILLSVVRKFPLNKNMSFNVLFFMLIVFIVFGTFSIIFSMNIYKAAVWHLITVYLAMCALFLASIIKNDKQLFFFLKGYVFGAVVNSSLGLIAYLAGKSQGRGNRLEGFFQDPNIFSPYIIIAILLVIEDLFYPKLFKSKPFKFFSIILMIGAVVLAMSRAGWINLAIALLLYFAVKIMKRQLKLGFALKVILIPISLLLSVYFLSPVLSDKVVEQLKERTTLQSYDNERFGAQFFTLDIVKNNAFGIGPGEITTIYYMDPHNTYLRIFAEYGWVSGVLLLLLFLVIIGVLLKKSVFHHKSEFNIYLVLLCALAGTLVNIIVVDALHWRHFWVLFALCYHVIIFKKDHAADIKEKSNEKIIGK
jgi:O-antigen ligase